MIIIMEDMYYVINLNVQFIIYLIYFSSHVIKNALIEMDWNANALQNVTSHIFILNAVVYTIIYILVSRNS